MKPILLTLAAATLALPAVAQDSREMEAHVHGVSKAEIAVEHGVVQINIHAPGMDIVGFEYAATSTEDKDAVEAAIRAMLSPENVVTLPKAAGCRLTEVLAHLHGGDHDHDDADAHMEGDHEKHDHEEHAGKGMTTITIMPKTMPRMTTTTMGMTITPTTPSTANSTSAMPSPARTKTR